MSEKGEAEIIAALAELKYLRRDIESMYRKVSEIADGKRPLPACRDHEARISALEANQKDKSTFWGGLRLTTIAAGIAIAVQQAWDKIFG